jgi:3',5'-cyclic AMP phosphodiesterase CpdA
VTIESHFSGAPTQGTSHEIDGSFAAIVGTTQTGRGSIMKTIIQSVLIYFAFIDFPRIAMLWCKFAAFIVFLVMGFNFFYFFFFLDFAVMSTQGSQFLPNSAEWTIWPESAFVRPDIDGPRPPLTTATYFSDGAICANYVDVWVDNPTDSIAAVRALDARDSRRPVSVKLERKPGLVSQKRVCTGVIPGSTDGPLAQWRSIVAHFLNVPVLGWVAVFILSVVALFAVLYVLGILLIILPSLGRGIWNGWKLWWIPQSARWFPDIGNLNPILLQISDPHITHSSAPYEIQVDPTMWPFSRPVDTLGKFRSLLAHVSATPIPPVVVISGDITDLGLAAEWEAATCIMQEFEDACVSAPRLLLLAGNHDISINVSKSPDYRLRRRREREAGFLHLAKRFHPQKERQSIAACSSMYELFPICEQIRLSGGPVPSLRIISLDSNGYRSRFMTSNAIGAFGKRQLRRLQALLFQETGPVILLTHHHITRAHNLSRKGRAGFQAIFLNALDAEDLLTMLLDYSVRPGNKVLVVHGHKHEELFERYAWLGGEVFVYGHPSSTMGNYDPASGQLDGVVRCTEIGLSSRGEWTIRTRSIEQKLSKSSAGEAQVLIT